MTITGSYLPVMVVLGSSAFGFSNYAKVSVNKQKEVVEEFLKNVETVLDNTDTAKGSSPILCVKFLWSWQ